MAKVQRHASVITPIRLGNRTELELKRFVPLALLFPIARRYWKGKPVAHRAKMRNIKTYAKGALLIRVARAIDTAMPQDSSHAASKSA